MSNKIDAFIIQIEQLAKKLNEKDQLIYELTEANKKWERDEREASIKIDQLEQRAYRAEQENIRLQNLNQRRK